MHKRLHLLFVAAILATVCALAQSPTHIDQGTNDPSVSIWDDPEYILLIAAIILLGLVFLFFQKRISRRKRRE